MSVTPDKAASLRWLYRVVDDSRAETGYVEGFFGLIEGTLLRLFEHPTGTRGISLRATEPTSRCSSVCKISDARRSAPPARQLEPTAKLVPAVSLAAPHSVRDLDRAGDTRRAQRHSRPRAGRPPQAVPQPWVKRSESTYEPTAGPTVSCTAAMSRRYYACMTSLAGIPTASKASAKHPCCSNRRMRRNSRSALSTPRLARGLWSMTRREGAVLLV